MTWAVRGSVLLLLVGATIGVYWTRTQLAQGKPDEAAVQALQLRLDRIPLNVLEGSYQGELDPEAPDIIERSGADAHVAMNYLGQDGHTFRLYVGGAVRLQRYFHRPRGCLPSVGWEVLDDEEVPFDAFSTAQAAPTMRRLFARKGRNELLVYFWFQSEDFVDSDTWSTSYFRFRDLVKYRTVRPSYIVTVWVPVIGNIEKTDDAAREFLRSVGPHIRGAVVGVE